MKLFMASDIGKIIGESAPVVRARLMAQVKAGFLLCYVVVPLGEPLDSPDSMIAFSIEQEDE